MKITGTKEAFAAILRERGVYRKLGVDRSTVANYRAYLRDGKWVSMDKMEEMLHRYGAFVAREKVWEVPSIEANIKDAE